MVLVEDYNRYQIEFKLFGWAVVDTKHDVYVAGPYEFKTAAVLKALELNTGSASPTVD